MTPPRADQPEDSVRKSVGLTHNTQSQMELDTEQDDSQNQMVLSTEQGDSQNYLILSAEQGLEYNSPNQVTIFTGVITFMEGCIIIKKVPFIKDAVNNQAQVYAHQGKKLKLTQGPHFTWNECFDTASKTDNWVAIVYDAHDYSSRSESMATTAKKRRLQNQPDRLEPATKEDFDVSSIGEIEEEEQW